jgi:ABC-type multidrug transport system fused ATPase/permease subunit
VNLPLRQYVALLSTYLAPQRGKVALLGMLLALNIALQLINPQILRSFIDNAANTSFQTLLFIALGFATTAIGGNVATGLATYVSEDVAWTATNALRSDLTRHTLNLDMPFHKAHTAGEMIERLDGDVTAMSNFFSQFVVRVLGTGALMIGVLVLMFREDWRIGLAMTVYAMLTLLVLKRIKNIAVSRFVRQREASADLSAFWEERLSGLEDIRSSGAVAYTLRQQFSLMRTLTRESLIAAVFGRILFGTIIILFSVGTATAIGTGAWLFGLGAITLGTVYLLFDYTGTLSSNLRVITEQLDDLQRASAGIARTAELLQTRSKITDGPQQDVTPGAATLSFYKVSFAYDDAFAEPGQAGASQNAPVLQSISFDVRPGAVLGLLGRTGSGKSTLIKLLFRFYDPTAGIITLDGVDLRQLQVEALRRRIGLVTQDVQLFQASVRDNLTFFDHSISDARILSTLHALELSDWLARLPKGLDSELQSDSGGLSAGEAQLLAFARVFLQDPGLVLLDEASSRLDPATERRIERAIDALLRGRTAIIIAHHLETVQRADDILILEDGRVREHGARIALAAQPDSRFAQLMRTGMSEALA